MDEPSLEAALTSGVVAGAALDVFTSEPPTGIPLVDNPKLIVTPHLGASTEEAQLEVALEVAEQVMAVLAGESAQYTINVPFVPGDVRQALAPYIPVAATMGRLAIQLSDGQLDSIAVKVAGDIAEHDVSILGSAALVGVLGAVSDARVNIVNAMALAKERGINVVEEKDPEGAELYANFVGVEVRTSCGKMYLGGTSVGGRVHLGSTTSSWTWSPTRRTCSSRRRSTSRA